jgi:hypothetical protein
MSKQVYDVGGKITTHDMHMFGMNPTWSKKLCFGGEAGVVVEGNNSMISDKGAMMMFMGYADQECNSVRMWDSRSTRVIVNHDVTWLNRMFFKNVMPGVIELDSLEEIGDNLGLGSGSRNDDDFSKTTSEPNIQASQPGGRVLWNNSDITTPSKSRVSHSGHIIKSGGVAVHRRDGRARSC